MFEYDSVSASAYDANSLVGKLNEKASDGWEVVSIVPTGGEVTAFLKRTAAAGSDGQAAATAEPEADSAAIAVVTPVSEPAGWASEPSTKAADEPGASTESAWGTGAAGAAGAAAVEDAVADPETPAAPEPVATPEPEPTPVPETAPASEPEPSYTAAAASAPAAAAASVPTTPAGWYPDPSGRYEMRYWDGDKWTEHVSRQGQTYTDPPVA
jgi:Protein of unknown function (DUF2510)